MDHLVDTTVLVRHANPADANHAVAIRAVAELHRRGDVLHVTPQVLIEFRNAATRPKAQNGLGLSIPQTEALAAGFEAMFPLLPDTPDIYPTWKGLVGALGVIGKRVHDARLMAVCHVHAVTHILTFNVTHFMQFATFGPGLIVVHPAGV